MKRFNSDGTDRSYAITIRIIDWRQQEQPTMCMGEHGQSSRSNGLHCPVQSNSVLAQTLKSTSLGPWAHHPAATASAAEARKKQTGGENASYARPVCFPLFCTRQNTMASAGLHAKQSCRRLVHITPDLTVSPCTTLQAESWREGTVAVALNAASAGGQLGHAHH